MRWLELAAKMVVLVVLYVVVAGILGADPESDAYAVGLALLAVLGPVLVDIERGVER